MLPCGGCRVSMSQRVKWLDGWNAFLNMILRWFIALVLSIPTLMPCPEALPSVSVIISAGLYDAIGYLAAMLDSG